MIELHLHLILFACSDHALVDHIKLMMIYRQKQLSSSSLVPWFSLTPNLGPHDNLDDITLSPRVGTGC